MAKRILIPVTVNLDLGQVNQVREMLGGRQSFSGLIRDLIHGWLEQQGQEQ